MNETKKIGFFKRIKIAIFDLEKYNTFLNEKLFVAFKYFFKFLILLVIIFSIATTIELNQKIDKVFSYFSNEFSNFEYKKGNLSVSEKVEAYDKKYDAKLIVDTGDVSDEQLIQYQGIAKENEISAILLKDKALIEINGVSTKFVYTDFMQVMGIEEFSKETLANKYNETGFMFKLGIAIFIYTFMILFVQYFLVVIENILIVAIFGWIASKLIGLKLKFSKAFTIAIYSLTLSNIINVLYSVIATFTTFEIKYFSLMYFIIGYIYMIAVIFMNKADLMNNNDAGEILQVVENINFVDNNEEVSNKKENKKNKNNEKDKTDEESKNDKSNKKNTESKKNIENKKDKNNNKNNEKTKSKNKSEIKSTKKDNSLKKENKDIKNEDNKD